MHQNDSASDEVGGQAVRWTSAKTKKIDYMLHSLYRMELPYMHGGEIEKAEAVTFGDVRLSTNALLCGRCYYAGCVSPK